MTFLEAAIELLRQSGEPLTVEELTSRAVEQRLLTNPGRSPEVIMRARLSRELDKGESTLLIRTGEGSFGLRRYDRPRLGSGGDTVLQVEVADVVEEKEAAEATEATDEGVAAGEGEGEAEGEGAAAAGDAAAPGEAKKRRRRRGGRGRGRKKKEEAGAEADAEASAEVLAAAEAAEPGTPEEALAAEALAAEAEREAQELVEEAARRMEEARDAAAASAEPPIDLDAFMAPSARPRVPVMLPDETALAAEYQEELEAGGGLAAPVEGELVDEHTADEDRPMLEEITAGDRGRGRRGRRERDRGRGRRDRDRERERGGGGAQAQKPAASAAAPERAAVEPPTAASVTAPAAPAGEGGLADAAHALLRSIGDGRPVHARQLAAMALKRKLLAGEQEELWKAMKAALLDDARARGGRGLRSRVRHHGGGSFALTTARLEPELAALEESLAQRAEVLRRETRAALRRRLARLPLPALEGLVRVWLERTEHTEIERAKRVDATLYLTARGRRGALPVRLLVGVRAGADEAGRRAVGELRAGVVAKQLDEGLLLCAGKLGGEAEREARAPGPPITALDGEAFADALLAAGVGVVRTAMPIAYLDADFFAELVEGG